MDLSIVIVNWNSRDYLKECLASLFSQAHDTTYEVVVIDSGSFDGCEQMLREHFPSVRFIQAETNLGFAAANNRAFDVSIGRSVLFLNPDTRIEGLAIDKLHEVVATRPDAGIVGCRLLNSDGSLQSSCVQAMPTILNQFLGADFLMRRTLGSLWGTTALYNEGSIPREVEGISGACLMVRRDTFEQVGRFSEDYFMYAEDMDLSYKTRRAGYRNYYVPEATVTHHGGSSSGRVSMFSAVMMREAIWRFLRKTRGRTYAATYRVAMLISATCRLVFLALPCVQAQSVSASRQKWRAILMWTLHRDPIVRRFYTDSGPLTAKS